MFAKTSLPVTYGCNTSLHIKCRVYGSLPNCDVVFRKVGLFTDDCVASGVTVMSIIRRMEFLDVDDVILLISVVEPEQQES